MKTYQRWALLGSAGLLITIGILSPGIPSYASSGNSPVGQCAEEAKTRDLGAWVCAGGTLYYADAGELDSATNDRSSDSTAADSMHMEVIVPEEIETESVYTNDATEPTEPTNSAAASDDWDTWCESIYDAQSTCSRVINDYIAELKRNMIFGSGVYELGHFDLVMRTNLNGRQAQWRVAVIRDWGQSLNDLTARITCKEDGNPFLCGVHTAGENVNVSANRWDSPQMYGNYLRNSNYYSGTVLMSFSTPGYTTIFNTEALTQRFNCLGTADDRCRI